MAGSKFDDKQGLGFGNATTYMNIPDNILVSLYLMKTNNVSMCMNAKICDWACENRAYLHKLHMFRKEYIASSLCMINDFCNLHIIRYEIWNKS